MVPSGGSSGGLLSETNKMTKPKQVSSDFRWGKKSSRDDKSKHHSHHSHRHRSHHSHGHHSHHHHHSRSHSRHSHRRRSSSRSHSSSSSSRSSSPYSSEDELSKGVEAKKPKVAHDVPKVKEPEEKDKKTSGLDLDALLLKQGILPSTQQAAPQRQAPPPPPPKSSYERKVNGTADLNELAAQAMRAKLKGDTAEYERIRSELERLRDPRGKESDQPQTVVIRRNKMMNSNDYDEENADLKTLYMREKGKGRSYDKALAMSIIKGFRGSSESNIDYSNEYGYDDDDGNNSYGDFSAPRKLTQQQIERRERKETQRLIREHIRAENRLKECYFCLENDRCEKKFVISLGESVYLALPVKGSLTKFHCLIVPSNHVTSIRTADEEVLEEVEKYKTGLLRMFHTMGMEPIFMETCLRSNSDVHTFIDVIPFERDAAGDAPMFFKEALTNCETEWSQHKKIIDTRGKKLSACIPPNFPYFHVDFDGKGGFLHVVESAKDFTHYFGRSVAASILQVSPELYIKPHRKPPQEEEADIRAFTKAWAPFDWTIPHEDDD